MLTGDSLWTWMGGDTPQHDLLSLLNPYPPEAMQRYPVSAMVNRPEIDTPDLVLPVAV